MYVLQNSKKDLLIDELKNEMAKLKTAQQADKNSKLKQSIVESNADASPTSLHTCVVCATMAQKDIPISLSSSTNSSPKSGALSPDSKLLEAVRYVYIEQCHN